jgi:DNA-binding NarL/FixJ family response regulator
LTTEHIRIVIADDSPPFLKGLRALLKSFADAELIGEATTGEEAIAFSATLQPDVILMDLQMPDVNGIEATHCADQSAYRDTGADHVSG